MNNPANNSIATVRLIIQWAQMITVIVALSTSLVMADSVTPKPSTASKESHSELGDRHLKEENLDLALSDYKKGWEDSNDQKCLLGIVTVFAAKKDFNSLQNYIEPIVNASKNDLIFLKFGIGIAVQTRDQKLFEKCLGHVTKKWLEDNSDLQIGIARGAIIFYSNAEAADKE